MKIYIVMICVASLLASCKKEEAESAPKPVVEVKVAEDSWDKFGTKIVSIRLISVHIGSLTVGLQPE